MSGTLDEFRPDEEADEDATLRRPWRPGDERAYEDSWYRALRGDGWARKEADALSEDQPDD
jgi:hypothetical protein